MLHWITLYTKPRTERQIHAVLNSRGIETYLPTIYQYNTHLRRKEPLPFFSCYLFTRIDLTSPAYTSLAWTPGLRGIVSFDGKVALLPDEVVARIQERLHDLDTSGYFERVKFQSGDRVVITSGPLKDLEVVFDRKVSKDDRVRILLEFLGQLTNVEIRADWLKKVSY